MTAPPSAPLQAGIGVPALPEFLGTGRSDLRARAAYAEAAGIFRIVPAAVAIPSTTNALRDLLLWAVRRRVPLTPRGAGSGMAGGNLGSGVILDLTALDGCPIEIRSAARRAYAGAGVTLSDLNDEAAREGLRLPPDPSSSRFATVGGVVSTNASGPHTVRAGSMRRWVEAVDMLTADGESLTLRRGVEPRPCAVVERFTRDVEPAIRRARDVVLERFPRTRKNSSGYALDAWLASGDLLDLVIGSEGTLGVVTGVEWKLEPKPPRYAGIRASLRDIAALAVVVPQLLECDPSALEYLDATFLSFVGQRAGDEAGLLMVEFEGDGGTSPAERLRQARTILRPHATQLEEASTPQALETLWAIRHAASPILARQEDGRRSMQVVEDGCVPIAELGAYIEAIRAAGQRHGVELVIFGHAGDGNLHVNLLPHVDREGWRERIAGVYADISEAVVRLKGTLTGEHGDGRLRARSLADVYGAQVVELFRRVKEAFDPVGILNPGVKIPAAEERPFTALKVGTDAAPLPPDIEAGLRDVERFARYGLSRLELADAVTGNR